MSCLFIQLRRCYHHHRHHQTSAPFIPNHHNFNYQIRACDRAVVRRPRFDIPQNVRFFAAPVQAKPKIEEKDPSGPRLNEKIKADVVRLVSDEGHVVVSRMEALQRASALKLDLVEVDRNAKPPVCKLMDYHREKYKKQLKEKDRAKSKSEVTLRKGDCKEVRFSVKTEQKDLEIKANTIRRLMDRGYRVKCMAMGTEEQDLGGLVARLSALIEDVAIVESGPRVEKKQAYIVVRHIKFGPSKKGGSAKKASKTIDVENPDSQDPVASNSSSIIEDEEIAHDSGLETDDELEGNWYKREEINLSAGVNSPVTENRYKRPDATPVLENRYKRPDSSTVIENRYERLDNSPVVENGYNRGNNSVLIENRYNRVNNSPSTENRYSRVNNSMPTENRYNRENNSLATENRYRRDNQYNPNAESGRERLKPIPQFRPNTVVPPSNNSRFPANDQGVSGTIENNVGLADNRYRNGNNFNPIRHPTSQGGQAAPPYSDGRRQSGFDDRRQDRWDDSAGRAQMQ